MTVQELKNHPMMKDFVAFTKAAGVTTETEQDVKDAMLRWVNHRVEMTPQLIDFMYRKTVADIKTNK